MRNQRKDKFILQSFLVIYVKKIRIDFNIIFAQVVQYSQRFLDDEVADGYRPCDPSIIVERVQNLEDGYAELVKFAVERR